MKILTAVVKLADSDVNGSVPADWAGEFVYGRLAFRTVVVIAIAVCTAFVVFTNGPVVRELGRSVEVDCFDVS